MSELIPRSEKSDVFSMVLRSNCTGLHYSLFFPSSDLQRVWQDLGLLPPRPLPQGFQLPRPQPLANDVSSMVLRSHCTGLHYSLFFPSADLQRVWQDLGLLPPQPLPQGFQLRRPQPLSEPMDSEEMGPQETGPQKKVAF
ncbi:hypothetical protein OTU49_000563 [Cherax quadricarinatus]|uniref:Uncharacterized protein n=1 Tax=Cherax quadricarinatus TaxID=27406 RepID=A0AAW0XXV2_CHEQU